jgi:hypothetical protein
MARVSRLLLLGMSLAGLVLPVASCAQDSLRVGTVSVLTQDVFSPEETARGWPYRALDGLHATTRESTVRKFLLFREGDLFRPEALAESERNLRAEPFIRSASVTASPPHDGVVDIAVTTQDSWTLEPTVMLARRGGVTTWGVALLERNLFGTGRQVDIRYEEEVDRISRGLTFIDPHFLQRYWKGFFIHENNSDGGEDHLGLQKDFVSAATPWAGTIRGDQVRRTGRIYESGVTTARFAEDRKSFLFEYGHMLAHHGLGAVRLSAGVELTHDVFDSLEGHGDELRPPDREFRYVYGQVEILRSEFMTLNYVDRDLRYEDFNLGPRMSLLGGVSPSLFGVDRTTGLLETQLSNGWRLGGASFLKAAVDARTRLGAPTNNGVVSGELRLVSRIATSPHQTLVSRIAWAAGWDLDPDRQFFADGATGLRGYPLYAFEGNRSVVGNLEYRIFLGKEIFQIMAPGLAMFVDSGTAVQPGIPFDAAPWKTDAGLGVRLAFPRASVHTLIRIDVAFPFNSEPLGRDGILVSFSSSQAF